MSDSQECSVARPVDVKESDPIMASFTDSKTNESEMIVGITKEGNSIPSSYLGEVPQLYVSDPHAFLPLNSDFLTGPVNVIRGIVGELDSLIEEELKEVSRLQRQISAWEERIRRNNSIIGKNLDQIKQNLVDMSYDHKNRDYWWGRGDLVLADYTHAVEASRSADWAWLIKKYGLKSADGAPIDHRSPCVEELCNTATNNLVMEYKEAGIRYEQTHKNKEAENLLLSRENSNLTSANEQLQKFIAKMYISDIEPLQDGALLFKEFVLKLKSFERQESQPTFGDLRSWAESFLDQFLKTNSEVPHRVVNIFRRLASIPLPAQNS